MAAMDNFNRPAGGDPRDHQPTEQFWPGPGVPPGGPGPGNDYPWQQAGPPAHPASNRRKTRRWAVGIALAALLAGGGVIAGASLASTTLSTAPTASTGTSGGGAAGSTSGGATAQGGGGAPASKEGLSDLPWVGCGCRQIDRRPDPPLGRNDEPSRLLSSSAKRFITYQSRFVESGGALGRSPSVGQARDEST